MCIPLGLAIQEHQVCFHTSNPGPKFHGWPANLFILLLGGQHPKHGNMTAHKHTTFLLLGINSTFLLLNIYVFCPVSDQIHDISINFANSKPIKPKCTMLANVLKQEDQIHPEFPNHTHVNQHRPNAT